MILELKDIRVNYEKVRAVKGLSLYLEEGEIITIIGPNGAGKSSTLRAISGQKQVSSGEIWFQGERIDKYPTEKIVAMGISQVPEGRRIFANMSVMENLRMGAFLRSTKEFHTSLEEVYELFPRLKERTHQKGGSLSGGEQQMLAISRALVAKPQLILFDEPTLGLSPILVIETARAIRKISQRGVSAILVEQNAAVALRLASRGYCLEAGNLAIEGACQDLLGMEHIKKVYLGG